MLATLDLLPTRRLLLEMLATPDNHPLLWQITPEPYYPPERSRRYWAIRGVLLMNPVTAIAVVAGAQLALGVVPFAGAIFGLRTAYTVTSIIAAQKETGRFELLKTTPPGEYGIHMLVVQAIFRHKNVLFGNGVREDLILQAMFCLTFGMALAFWLFTFGVNALFFGVIVVAGALYIDFRQSIVLGTLSALVAAAWTNSRLNARLLSLTMYIGVQLGAIVGVLGGTAALQAAFGALGLDLLAVASTVALAVVLALREAVIGGLDHYSRQVGA